VKDIETLNSVTTNRAAGRYPAVEGKLWSDEVIML
jgi:hypothetical protein